MEKEVTKMTRAEKTAAVKELFKILLEKKNYKRTELIDEAAKLYQERFPGEDTENVNDVKGRMGSVFTIMKEEGEMLVENGVCSLPKAKDAEKPIEVETPEKPKAKTRKKAEPKSETTEIKEGKEEKPKAKRAKKAAKAEASQTAEVKAEAPKEGKEEPTPAPAPKKRGRKKAETKTEELVAVVEAKTEDRPVEVKAETEGSPSLETPVEEKPKKKTTRGRKKTEIKAEETQAKAEETPEKVEEVVKEELPEVKAEVFENNEKPQAEEVTPTEKKEEKKKETEVARVFDLSLLLGEKLLPKKGKDEKTESGEKPSEPIEKTREEKAENSRRSIVAKKTEKEENEGGRVELKEQPKPEKPQEKTQTKEQEKPVQKPQGSGKPEPKPAPAKSRNGRTLKVKSDRPLTADEALKEAYLKKLRSLGGDYFEYYSVYLLERYSLKNGRRLEGLKISGGDHDGGIDGEIELTDKFGFRETIYIQAKNWNPEKGDERLWVVGETLLQQFIGACVCRQAKEGKRHCRGIFVTTSRFTPEAKRILDDMSDKIVGYDGSDLFDAAKECSFGLKQKDGVWVLDEELLSGEKAFFNMF